MTLQIFKNITKLANRLGIYTVAELTEYKQSKNIQDTKDFIMNLINDVENAPNRNYN